MGAATSGTCSIIITRCFSRMVSPDTTGLPWTTTIAYQCSMADRHAGVAGGEQHPGVDLVEPSGAHLHGSRRSQLSRSAHRMTVRRDCGSAHVTVSSKHESRHLLGD